MKFIVIMEIIILRQMIYILLKKSLFSSKITQGEQVDLFENSFKK